MKRVVSIHGSKWDIHEVPPSRLKDYRRDEQADGDCVVPSNPSQKLSRNERRIRIANNLKSDDLLETLIHEVLHAMFPEKNEEWISDSAEDIAVILCGFGFARKGHDDGE